MFCPLEKIEQLPKIVKKGVLWFVKCLFVDIVFRHINSVYFIGLNRTRFLSFKEYVIRSSENLIHSAGITMVDPDRIRRFLEPVQNFQD